ncbi:MAG: hypothetical protein ACT4PV_14010 [Planctomycetaceae bacterium]
MTRALKTYGSIALVAVACGLLGSHAGARAGPASLEVERLTLKDEAGRVRAVLRMEGDSPRLELMDGNGKRRLLLAVDEEGDPGLVLTDTQGVNRAAIALADAGSSYLTLRDGDKRSRVLLFFDAAREHAGLILHAANEKQGVVLGAAAQGKFGSVLIAAADAEGTHRALLGINDNGRPQATLQDAKGQTCAGLVLEEDDLGVLFAVDRVRESRVFVGRRTRDASSEFTVRDKRGNTLTAEADDAGVPRLRLRNSLGEIVWEVPER